MFKTISDVKAANKAAGYYFFSRSTNRFFGSRVESSLYGGRFFITSEDNFDRSARFYTIREALPGGDIRTVSEFNGFRYIEDARDECRRLVKESANAQN